VPLVSVVMTPLLRILLSAQRWVIDTFVVNV